MRLVDLWHFLLHQPAGRVVLAVAALVAAKFVMDLLVAVNHWLFASERAPIRALLPERRVGLTVNAVLLSIIRYVIYFVVVGWILRQFGVRPGTYLASVSFVAIALGFGSQGLVQDVVNGFFLIFERQMDVGDLVTLDGQTGVIEDFGLRLTRIRGYDGSVTTLPNRSISQVVNYRDTLVQATLDVALPAGASDDLPAKVAAALRQSGETVAQQFAGIVRGPVRLSAWHPFATGGGFVRARLAIWPQQVWVSEGQWLPRLQQTLAAAGLDPSAYQVAVHYFAAQPRGPEPELPLRRRRRAERLPGARTAAPGPGAQTTPRDRGASLPGK